MWLADARSEGSGLDDSDGKVSVKVARRLLGSDGRLV